MLANNDDLVPWVWRTARGVYDWWHPARIDVRPVMARDERGRLVSAGAQWFETRPWVGKAVEWAGMAVFALTVLAALVVVWKVLGYAEIYRYDRERIARVWHLYNVKLGLDATLTIATPTGACACRAAWRPRRRGFTRSAAIMATSARSSSSGVRCACT